MEPAAEDIVQPIAPTNNSQWYVVVVGALAVIGAGVLTGYLLIGTSSKVNSSQESQRVQKIAAERPKSAEEDKAFSDCAEGRVEAIKENERSQVDGTHKLVNSDPKKSAYLTSSVVDLGTYEGKAVTVWGESHASNKVGWLMDVGRVITETGKCKT